MARYSPVYSTSFVLYTPSTPNNSFLVPEGFDAVVRQGTYYEGTGVGYADVVIQNSEAAPGITIMALKGLGVNQVESAEGRWFVPSGGVIYVFEAALGTQPQVYVGGYLLRTTAA
jgi:hypothetical protein